MFETSPLSPAMGIEIQGIDLALPLADEDADALRAAFAREGLVVVRGQALSKRAQVAATWHFGEPEIHPLANAIDHEVPEIMIVGSHGRDGDVEPHDDGTMVHRIDWHTDLAYVPVPNRGALLHGIILPPEGGLTGFVDRARTYATLPEATKARLEGLHVVQSWRFAQEIIRESPNFRTDEGAKMLDPDRFPDLAAPLVFAHPETGQKILNVTRMWSSAIVELPGAEGRALLDDLIAHSLQERFVYWHQYRPGDLVIWDNWRAMHAASGTRPQHRRKMHRTTSKGSVAFGRAVDRAAA